jgi:hypothetical protein
VEPKIAIEEIGPEQAAEILQNNDHNRRTDWRVIDNYARQMTDGEWTFVGDPIRISVTGRLLDGQYRLNAIIQSQTTQRFTVIRGLPNESQPFMDVGKRRSPGDVFSMYDIPAPGPTAALTQLLMRYERGMVLEQKYSITAAEALEYYQGPANTALINEGTKRGLLVKKMLPLNPSVAGVVFVAARRHSDPFAVNAFFEQLTGGLGLQADDDPIAALRGWLMRRKREDLRVNRAEFLWLLTRVWNAWATKEPMARVQLPKGGLTSKDQIPKLLAVGALEDAPVSEDNPVATPYNHTRKERDARARAS